MKTYVFSYIIRANSEEEAKELLDEDFFTMACQNDKISEVMSIEKIKEK